MPFKNQKHPLKQNVGPTKIMSKIFGMPQASCFQISQKKDFLIYLFFFTKESLILNALKPKILVEIKQSNDIKKKKKINQLFQDIL